MRCRREARFAFVRLAYRIPGLARVMPLSTIRSNSGLGATSKAVGPLDLLGDDELPQALGEVDHPLFLADPDGLAPA